MVVTLSDLTASLGAICARVVGAAWDDTPPIHKANLREHVMEVLNAAVAEGWRAPGVPPVTEWSVSWSDPRMPLEVRLNRAACRDRLDTQSLSRSCLRGDLQDIKVEFREVITGPWVEWVGTGRE